MWLILVVADRRLKPGEWPVCDAASFADGGVTIAIAVVVEAALCAPGWGNRGIVPVLGSVPIATLWLER